MKTLFTVLIAFVLLTNSCKKYVPAPEAFFIQPTAINLAITSTVQGSSGSKITDLFLYVDGKYQGVYQPSSKLPIVTRGQHVTIDVLAGVKNNGIKETVITWPFFTKIEFDTLVESGKTVNRNFTFQYNPLVTFLWTENFEQNISLIKSANTNTSSTFTTFTGSGAYEGTSGVLDIGPNIFAQLETSIPYAIPHGNGNVYLELNYKCDVKINIGITDANGLDEKDCITLNEKAEWNKIYIQLADAVNREPLYDNAKIIFRAENPNRSTGVRVWFDNIKLIYL
jgi:hypothetical protein